MPPKIQRLAAGEQAKGVAAICLPLRVTVFDEKGDLQETAVQMAEYTSVLLSMGYGFSEFTPDLQHVNTLDSFLKWQRIVKSNEVPIAIR